MTDEQPESQPLSPDGKAYVYAVVTRGPRREVLAVRWSRRAARKAIGSVPDGAAHLSVRRAKLILFES